VRGYHPLIAALAGTGEVVGVRLRGGNVHTGRGAAGFFTQMFNRVRRAGATGPMVLRADSGFYNHNVTEACKKAKVSFSITVKASKKLHKAVAAIPEEAWRPIPYWIDDGADVAETTYRPFSAKHPEVRLIVRRVKPTPGSQLALFATFDYHAFITNREGETLYLEADHRRHAVVEDVIRDLKDSFPHYAVICSGLREQSNMIGFHLDTQAVPPPAVHVHGGELAALDLVQHRLSGDPESLRRLPEGEPPLRRFVGDLRPQLAVEAYLPGSARGEL
jgi:hypothetical protein